MVMLSVMWLMTAMVVGFMLGRVSTVSYTHLTLPTIQQV